MSISTRPPLWNHPPKTKGADRANLHRSSALGGASLMLLMALSATPAFAADECGAAVAGTVTCAPTGNPYADGISYSPVDDDLTVALEDGVNISLSTTPANSNALFVGSQAGNISVTHESGLIESGNDSFATVSIDSQNGGDVTATLDEVRGSGLGGRAIDIGSNLGATSLTVNKVQTSGDSSNGIIAFGRESLTINVGSVATTGSSSIAVQGLSDGVVMVNAGDVVTEGDESRGIYLRGKDDITLTADSVVTSGTESVAVHIQGYTPGTTATINITNAVTAGNDSSAIHVTHSGDIMLSAETVETTGDNSDAIYLRSSEGFATVTIGSIVTQGGASHGLTVDALGGANVTVGQISTLGDMSTGVDVHGEEDLTIVSTDGIATQGVKSAGISAESSKGSVTITASNISTGGFEASGIEAISYDSFATVTADSVTTAGDNAHGVDVRSMDAAAIAAATNVTTSGEGAFGVVVGTVTGSVSVTATDITTTGLYAIGVAAHSYGDGALSVVANNVSTTGDNAIGVGAMSYGQSASSVTANNVSTTGTDAYGIMVRTGLSADVVASNITTSGDNAHGILVFAQDEVNVSVTGPVSTTGAGAIGVVLQSDTDITLDATGPITTSGDNALGVAVEGNSGVTSITVADVATTGTDAIGIFADTYGDITVKAGNISTAQAQAISAESTANITIATTGNITSASTNAIEIRADQLATINIAEGSIIGGTTSAIVGGGLDSTLINNDGTINAGSAETILSTIGPVTLNNSGTFHGRVTFGGADDVIDNSGDFHAAGTSNFGTGTNLFINSGTFTAETADMQGLSRFSNSGIVSLQNDAVGDHLTLSGDYYGEGGELAMDIDFAAGTADLLTIGGAATGLTTVSFNVIGTPALLGSSFAFVEAGAGSESDAFVTDNTVQAGFYGYIVTFDAANNDYLVTPTIGDATFGTLKFNEAAQSLWYKTADVVSAHLADRRHGGGQHNVNGRIWGQLHGSYDKRDQLLSYPTAAGDQTSDVSYRQDYFGGQLGVDLGAAESDFGFGLTAGYVNSKIKLAAREDRAKYDAFNFGIYAGYNGGNFFANMLAKYDVYNIKARSVLGDYAESFDGKSYGAQLEAGFRFGSDSFFAEPVASLAWVRTDLDKLAVSNVVINFDKLDGLRGKLGIRVGGISPMAGGSFTWYAGGHAVKEFEGRDGVTFTDGINKVHLANQRIGTYGQADVGISILSANGVAGFIEGNAKFGDDYRGYGGRVGLRLAF